MRKLLFLLVFAPLLAGPHEAHAQSSANLFCYQGPTNPQWAPCNSTNPLSVTLQNGGFPSNATAITGNATGTTGAVVGTLAAVAAKTTYICGFNVSATGGTAAIGPITIAGTITGSFVFELNSSVAGTNISENFSPCVPASAANTAITTTTTADGTASAVAVNSWGYQQ
jgi:hypothetical protein